MPGARSSPSCAGHVMPSGGAIATEAGCRVRSRRPCVPLAGLMIVISATHAQGTDLRPARNTDLVSLVQSQSRRNAELTRQLTSVRKDVDGLAARGTDQSDLAPDVSRESRRVGLTAVTGPGVTVILDDAPASVAANGIEPDLLVVHQQDIQAVVNALWSGGAEAMTIQDQRVISTTAVKCVGNTVVLHGIPYAPPYRIRAIGDPITAARCACRLGADPDLSAIRGGVRAGLSGEVGGQGRSSSARGLARP